MRYQLHYAPRAILALDSIARNLNLLGVLQYEHYHELVLDGFDLLLSFFALSTQC